MKSENPTELLKLGYKEGDMDALKVVCRDNLRWRTADLYCILLVQRAPVCA